jgi:DNA-binding LytR/AlgR family response regulator
MDNSTLNTPLKIALCEDAQVDAELLSALINLSEVPNEMETFGTGEALLETYKKDKYDLIFLDVFMGELSGVQTAEKIREIDTHVVIVFTTTSDDYTREGYRLNAYKYLIKPVNLADVKDALDLAVMVRDKAAGASLAIVTDNVPVFIPLHDIIFVESSNRKSLIYTLDKTYATTMTIDSLEKLLPAPRFLRSHRSYIVNLDHVDDVDEDFIMDNGDIAYIAVKNRRKIKSLYDEYLFNSVRNNE